MRSNLPGGIRTRLTRSRSGKAAYHPLAPIPAGTQPGTPGSTVGAKKPMRLNDKVAVVTGGTRGIGRGIVEAFLEEGARVVLNGRSLAKGEAALGELTQRERAHVISGDVTQEGDVRSVIDGAVERFGRLDIVVNNAGGSLALSPIVDLETEDWNHTILWNLSATFWGTKYALRHMIPQGSAGLSTSLRSKVSTEKLGYPLMSQRSTPSMGSPKVRRKK